VGGRPRRARVTGGRAGRAGRDHGGARRLPGTGPVPPRPPPPPQHGPLTPYPSPACGPARGAGAAARAPRAAGCAEALGGVFFRNGGGIL
jgi:hypothetical protein